MVSAGKRWTALSGEDLGRLLSLLKGADSVELKLTIPESEGRSALAALGIDPLQAQVRQVFFFDNRGSPSTAPGWWCGLAGSRARAATRW
jgi:hypothetical protein